jgi:hypothetical protein
MDKRKERGGDHKSDEFKSKGPSEPIDSKRSAEITGEVLGISATKVKKARTVMDLGDKETKG